MNTSIIYVATAENWNGETFHVSASYTLEAAGEKILKAVNEEFKTDYKDYYELRVHETMDDRFSVEINDVELS